MYFYCNFFSFNSVISGNPKSGLAISHYFGLPMIVLSPKKVAGTLCAGAVFIALVNVFSDLYHFFSGGGYLKFSRFFSFDSKISIPTWYSSTLMLICALLLGAIANHSRGKGDRDWVPWGFFALVFLALSLDEVAGIHVRINFMTRYVLQSQAIRYGMYLMIAASVGLVLWVCRKFFARLPKETRWQLSAGSLFYIGSVAIDRFDKRIWREQDFYTVSQTPGLFTALDELLELVGLVIFIYALLTYIGKTIKELQIKIYSS
jgi:hypothetical protein